MNTTHIPTRNELEREAGQRRLARLAGPKTDGAAPLVIPFDFQNAKPAAAFDGFPIESLAEGIKRPAPKIASQVAVPAPNAVSNSTPAPPPGASAPKSVDRGKAPPADAAANP